MRNYFDKALLPKDLFKNKKVVIEIFDSRYGSKIKEFESSNVMLEQANLVMFPGTEAMYCFLPNKRDILMRYAERESEEKALAIIFDESYRWSLNSRAQNVDYREVDFTKIYDDSFLAKLYNDICSFLFCSKHGVQNYWSCLTLSINKTETETEDKIEKDPVVIENKTILSKLSKEISEDVTELPVRGYESMLEMFKK